MIDLEQIEQLHKPVIAEKVFTNENGNTVHITIRDSLANAEHNGLYIRVEGPDSTATYDMTTLEADWLYTLLRELF